MPYSTDLNAEESKMPKMTRCNLGDKPITVEAALDLRNDFHRGRAEKPEFRCTKCGQAVRVHKGSPYAAAHFEHLERNERCSQSSVK